MLQVDALLMRIGNSSSPNCKASKVGGFVEIQILLFKWILRVLLPCTHGNSDTKHRVTTLIIAYEIHNVTKHNEIWMVLSVKFCVTRGWSAYENWQFKFTKLWSKQSRGLCQNINSVFQISELRNLQWGTHDTKHCWTTLIFWNEIPKIK